MDTEIRVVAKSLKTMAVELPMIELPVVNYSIQEISTSDDGIVTKKGLDWYITEVNTLFKTDEPFVFDKMKDCLSQIKKQVEAIEEALDKEPLYWHDNKISTEDQLYTSW